MTTTIKEKWQLFNPITWPIWAGLGFLWLLTRLPYRFQLSIGSFLGSLLYAFPSKLKHISAINLKLCFPDMNEKERQQLMKKNFASLGIGLLEAAMAWWLPDKKLNCLLHISGIEYAEEGLAKGKGIILLSPHFTCLEMIGRLVGMKYAFTAMYRPHRKPLIAFIQERFRNKRAQYIPRHKMRLLFDALKRNEAVWYAYDVDAGKKRGVFVPFFGIPTASLTALSRIAETTGATVVPIRFYRRDDNQGYDVIFSPPLQHFPSQDAVEDATRLNAILENAIREKPEQYIWQYKRFKTRPAGEKKLY